MTLLSDTGIVSPQPSKLIDASTKRGIETREAMKRVVARFRARKAEHKAMKVTVTGLTQADIDGRVDGWEASSDSTVALMRRKGIGVK